MTRLIRTVFEQSNIRRLPPRPTTDTRSLTWLATELRLPDLPARYGENKEAELYATAFDNTKVSITLHPMEDKVPPAYKGFDLRVTVCKGDDEPYAYALFFREKEPARFYMNGCLYARDESGFMNWPRLDKDETLRAVTRMYLSHTLEKNIRPLTLKR